MKHGADFAVLAEYLVRARAVVTCLRRIAQTPPEGTVDAATQELEDLERDLGKLTHWVQHRACELWGARQPAHDPRARHDAAARVQRSLPPQSSEVEDSVVARYGLKGRLSHASDTAPPTSGRWTNELPRGPGSRPKRCAGHKWEDAGLPNSRLQICLECLAEREGPS